MDVPIRLGVLRPAAAAGALTAAIAAAEARVLEHELTRRLGPVTLDLCVDGDAIGPWQPITHASWPDDVDHIVAAEAFWDGTLPQLTTLFARTIEPEAAVVRRRMLHHLGILPMEVVDVTTLTSTVPALRPTDLWLLVDQADQLDTDDPAVIALTGAAEEGTELLVRAFDALAAEVLASDSAGTTQQRLQRALAAAEAARVAASEAEARQRRHERETVEALDALQARLDVLVEQAERDELRRSLEPDET